MRFKLTLRISSSESGHTLPASYSYEISEWLNSFFLRNKDVLKEWLLQNNLSDKIDEFRWFCYSELFIPSFHKQQDRIVIDSDRVELLLSFFPEVNTEETITALFLNQKAEIGDFLSKITFTIARVERLETPDLTSAKFKSISPLYISIRRDNGTEMSISPETDSYGKLLFNNLLEKYQQFYGKAFEGNPDYYFKLLEPSYSKSIIVKAGSKQEYKLRGFSTSFLLETDPELLRIGYEAGFGQNNAIGFGMMAAI